jgi:two-component system LytT family response regulator
MVDMITAVIIDDEKNNVNNLLRLLQKHCPMVKVLGYAFNAVEGRKMILAEKPDLVFLDIQMPGENGFDLLRSLPEHFFGIIFVTAYDQYGIQAVKMAAIDYLLKPINVKELKIAVDKAIERLSMNAKKHSLESLLQMIMHRQEKDTHRIALITTKETRFVRMQDIIRCESSNNYTTFFLLSGERLLVSRPIFEFELLLKDYGFLRCHQSHLVNRQYIKSWLKGDGGFLLLEDASRLPVSRQKKEYIKEQLH